MSYDYSKLKGKIIEVCGTRRNFAEKLGITEQSISNKLNGKYRFSQEDMAKIVDILNLSEADIPTYFFTKKLT